MLGFCLLNLFIPNNPDELILNGNHGEWRLAKDVDFDNKLQTITSKRTICLETYTITHDHSLGGSGSSRIADELLKELNYVCLSLSYLTGSAVTFERSLPMSDITFIQVGDSFPRMRGLSSSDPVTFDQYDFKEKLDTMINAFERNQNTNNINIIIHHLLDSTYCWSLEDLFLSLCTVLEIIKQNERRRTGNSRLYFYDSIASVARHLGITVLNEDFKNMRNDLIHEGHLSKIKFSGHTKSECSDVVCDVLNWIDEYVHAIFSLGDVKNTRYPRNTLSGLNSYTTW